MEQEPKKLRETPPMEHFTQQVGETAIENCKILDSSTLLRKPDLQGSRVSLKRRSIYAHSLPIIVPWMHHMEKMLS